MAFVLGSAPVGQRRRSPMALLVAAGVVILAGASMYKPFAFVGSSPGRLQKARSVAMYGSIVDVPGGVKKGLKVIIEGSPCEILEFQGKKVGKGVGIVKTKIRNLITGANVEHTLKSGTKLEEIETRWKDATYSYMDGDNFNFMDAETYEELSVPRGVLGEGADWVQEGMEVELEHYDGRVVQFRFKADIIETVAEVPDQATGNQIVVVLNNGVQINGPSYLKVGDKVVISKKEFRFTKRFQE